MDRFRVLGGGPESTILAWGPLLTFIHTGIPQDADFDAVHVACSDCVATYGYTSAITITALLPSLQLPANVRERAARLTRDFRETSLAGAIVVPEDGLRAAWIRSVITGFNLLARASSPQQVFASVGEAVRWIAAVPGQPPALAEEAASITLGLLAYLAELRSGLARAAS